MERFLLYIVFTSRLFSLSKQHLKDLFHCFFWPTLFLTTNLEPLFCFPKFKMSFLVWLFKSIFCVTGFQKLVRMCLFFPLFLSYFDFIDLVGSVFMYSSHLKNFLPLLLSDFFFTRLSSFVESISFMLGQLILS